MGRILLILLSGFAASFGILAYSKDHRMLESVDRMVNRVDEYSTKNTATSGAFMALNKLYQSNSWRTGYSSMYLGNDSLSVIVDDNSTDLSIPANYVRVLSTSYNSGSADTTRVMLFDGGFGEFAVWAKDSVTNVITTDSALGLPAPSLMMAPAPYMPEINRTDVENAAAGQGHVETGPEFHPNDGYPNGDFFASGSVPNVTHVQGDMFVHNGRTVYGIFLVEGSVHIDPDGALYGVLYMPNTGSTVEHVGGGVDIGRIRGGVITWGTMDGGTNIIRVRHWPTFLNSFVSNYASDNQPMRVVSWE
jgi:hypothetical protein